MNFGNSIFKVFHNQLGGAKEQIQEESYPNNRIISDKDYEEIKRIVNLVINTNTIENMPIEELNNLKNKLLNLKEKNKIIDKKEYKYAKLHEKKELDDIITWTVPTEGDMEVQVSKYYKSEKI